MSSSHPGGRKRLLGSSGEVIVDGDHGGATGQADAHSGGEDTAHQIVHLGNNQSQDVSPLPTWEGSFDPADDRAGQIGQHRVGRCRSKRVMAWRVDSPISGKLPEPDDGMTVMLANYFCMGNKRGFVSRCGLRHIRMTNMYTRSTNHDRPVG